MKIQFGHQNFNNYLYWNIFYVNIYKVVVTDNTYSKEAGDNNWNTRCLDSDYEKSIMVLEIW